MPELCLIFLLLQPISGIPTTAAINDRTPPKTTTIRRKKPLEAVGSPPPTSSNKKKKVSEAYADQTIEQLNDVTVGSGVNLREEEEQLFSGSRKNSNVSEASRTFLQDHEERPILQKIPLQKKLAEIMEKFGLKAMGNDVERCLSWSVEERMQGIIRDLIRLSKQRVDIEKHGHRAIITSDVRQHVATMNQKAREEWEKTQAEAGKLLKNNQLNKEEDEMRATAANLAARAGVGGADMLSKWQLMAEQNRQKRDDGEPSSDSQPTKDASHKPVAALERQAEDSPSGCNVATSGSSRVAPQVPRTISVKDVIAFVDRNHTSLSTTLYEKIKSQTPAK